MIKLGKSGVSQEIGKSAANLTLADDYEPPRR